MPFSFHDAFFTAIMQAADAAGHQKGEGIRMNNGRPNGVNQPGMGYMPQNQHTGYQQPYQPQQGYAPQQGYPQGQPGFGAGQYQPPYQQPYQQPYQPQQGFGQQTGYQQPYGRTQTVNTQNNPQQPPFAYHPQRGAYQQYPQPGQQTRQQPFAAPGYQQQAYQQGYTQQMGGYQPPVQKPKSTFKPETLAMIVLCGILPVLFVLGLVLPGMPVLKWVFVALAVISVAALWLKPLVAPNVRLTFSGVYGALAVVALVSALTGAPAGNGSANQQGSQANNNRPSAAQQQQQQQQPAPQQMQENLGGWVTDAPAATPAPANGQNASAAVKQLESFFYFWSVNNQDNMIGLCAPSWQRSVEEPKKALFAILQNRIPLEWSVEKISGTDNDVARTVSVVANIDKRNGRDPEKYRFQVIMLKENETWYVDPASLQSNEKEQATAATANDTATPPPAAVEATVSTVLYYNPDGGASYHIDDMCPSAASKYLPFKGSFTYGEIGNAPYKDLKPCLRCGAPMRP